MTSIKDKWLDRYDAQSNLHLVINRWVVLQDGSEEDINIRFARTFGISVLNAMRLNGIEAKALYDRVQAAIENHHKTSVRAGADQLFDELKAIAVRYIDRAERVAHQSDYIIATVHTNLKRQAETGDTFARDLAAWMDVEIAKMK